jgi:protein-S-isoprenylcysteine O-methyltransferase Ste14
MTIRQRWIDLLHAAATGTRATRILLTPIGLLIFAVFTTLFVGASLLVDTIMGFPALLPESARLPVGVPLMALGVALIAWSAFHFLRARGTPVPFNPPPKLVTTGPYRLARNPMLSGVFILLFGIGATLGSVSLVLVFTPAYILFNVWELEHIEEPELVRRLGDAYVEYRDRTPMFLPGGRHRAQREE